MVAGTIVAAANAGWAANAGSAANAASAASMVPAQSAVLRQIGRDHQLIVDLTDHRRLRQDVVSSVVMSAPVRPTAAGRRPAAGNRPLASFPALPAGRYRIVVHRHGGSDGWVMAGVASEQFALATEPIRAYDSGVELDLPVDVRSLTVRADEMARDQLDEVDVVPVRIETPMLRGAARHAVRYGETNAFFLDERAFPEPLGFWVAGESSTDVVIARDPAAAACESCFQERRRCQPRDDRGRGVAAGVEPRRRSGAAGARAARRPRARRAAHRF